MPDFADLEIRILRRHAEGYPVEITLNGEQQLGRGILDPALTPWIATADPVADGERLFRGLLSGEALIRAWAAAGGQHPARRIRLRIDADAPELHAIPWELLREPPEPDPKGLSRPLGSSSATPFSRYLAGAWQPGGPVLKRPLRILVAIANPAGLGRGDWAEFAPIEEELEWAALQEAVAGQDVELTRFPPPPRPVRLSSAEGETVPIGGNPAPLTLLKLQAELGKGYHVLHLICHGSYSPRTGEAAVFLADEEGQVRLVRDVELAEMLARQLANTEIKPDDKLRLVFLHSCQTAARSPADAFRGLAPRLVAAGVPAVLAMQDRVEMGMARQFAAAFYRQLLQHGLADLAANEARSAVISAFRSGAEIPVLFMRLRNGQLLGQRGELAPDQASSFWTTLLASIEYGECTPFLGPGVTASLLPSPLDLAGRLAAKYHYPYPATESLPRVAQFVAAGGERILRRELIGWLVEGFRRRMELPPGPARGLSEAIAAARWPACARELFENEIHGQLADLGLPLYVTTNFDNFMTLALQDRLGADRIRRETVKWRDTVSAEAGPPHFDLDAPPTAEAPVVLHLFGADEDPPTMVLTEDDYLTYLAHIARDFQYLFPTSIQAQLASTSLLFLGYRPQDLDLKVILRGLLPNLDLAPDVRHVAVQVEPDITEQARLDELIGYLRKYFGPSRIDVYWGSAQQFVQELHARWTEAGGGHG